MTNTFIAHRTARRGVVRVEATLADFTFPAHSHDLGRALITGESADIGHFKIPTLRNIRHTPPYFRDGSAKTLEDVVNHYQQFIKALGNVCDENTGECDMTDQDKSDVVEFLQLL